MSLLRLHFSQITAKWWQDMTYRQITAKWWQDMTYRQITAKWWQDMTYRQITAKWWQDMTYRQITAKWWQDMTYRQITAKWWHDIQTDHSQMMTGHDMQTDHSQMMTGHGIQTDHSQMMTWQADISQPNDDWTWHADRSQPNDDRTWHTDRSQPNDDWTWHTDRSQPNDDRIWHTDRSQPNDDWTWHTDRSQPNDDRTWHADRSQPNDDRIWHADRSQPNDDRTWHTDTSQPKDDRTWQDIQTEHSLWHVTWAEWWHDRKVTLTCPHEAHFKYIRWPRLTPHIEAVLYSHLPLAGVPGHLRSSSALWDWFPPRVQAYGNRLPQRCLCYFQCKRCLPFALWDWWSSTRLQARAVIRPCEIYTRCSGNATQNALRCWLRDVRFDCCTWCNKLNIWPDKRTSSLSPRYKIATDLVYVPKPSRLGLNDYFYKVWHLGPSNKGVMLIG